jgi:hypothetical protein
MVIGKTRIKMSCWDARFTVAHQVGKSMVLLPNEGEAHGRPG